jgi:hypothetical protein
VLAYDSIPPGTLSITAKLPPSASRRSMRYHCVVPVPAVHARSIRDEETAFAVSPVGAPGAGLATVKLTGSCCGLFAATAELTATVAL